MIIFLYGSDTYRSREKMSAFKQKFIRQKDKNGLNISVLQRPDLTVDELRKATLSGSLFSKKRLIVIEGLLSSKATKKQEPLIQEVINFLKKIRRDEDNIVIFWDEAIEKKELTKSQDKLYQLLKKEKIKQEFEPLKPYELKNWIKREVSKNKVKIENQAIDLLVDACGNNLWSIKNELDKLTAWQKDSFIRSVDVKNLVLEKLEQNIWKLVDAIGAKNKKLSLRLLSDQIRGGASIDYLILMLARQYRILLKIKAYLAAHKAPTPIPAQIARSLSLHSFVCQKGLRQEKNYNLAEIKKIYRQLLKIDLLRKTRPITPEVLLNLLIVKS